MSTVWIPKNIEQTQMWQFMRFVETQYPVRLPNYEDLHAWSVQKPALFWKALVDFFKFSFNAAPINILSHGEDMLRAQWFEGAQFNFAEKLLQGTEDQTAIISLDETGRRQTLTYRQLRIEVAACAAGLKHLGITSGDRVAAVMPNVTYTIIAFLATASIGAIWSSCSTDFGTDAAFERLGQIEPKVLFVSNGHVYQGKTHDDLPKAKQLSDLMPSLKQVVVCPVVDQDTPLENFPNASLKNFPKAILWNSFIHLKSEFKPIPQPFHHPIYILFSSGTTGKPKCIIHSAGGTLLQHLKELGLHTDLRSTDNLLFYTTCGWMMWNWMVSVLALGATLTLYEGSPLHPDAHVLFRILEQENITVFGTSAKFLSSVEKAGACPREILPSLKHLRCILSTGSPLLPKNYDYVYQCVKEDVQLCSISGGTDIVSCFALGNPILPVHRGELQCLGLGMDVAVFDELGQAVQGERGELVCRRPFPSMPVGFWNDESQTKYRQAYFARFPGAWAHGDFAEITPHQGLIIYGRSDAVLNPGGVRIGTAEIYRPIEKIPEILDSAVVDQTWNDDVRVVLFVKLQSGVLLNETLEKIICNTLRTQASPRHVPSKILQVPDIPRTINGKIVELAIRQTIHNEPVQNLSSIVNPEALEYFKNRPELSF